MVALLDQMCGFFQDSPDNALSLELTVMSFKAFDVVECAALVVNNHGIVILIMNEYGFYGKAHTIHSSGQIEWLKNSVDDGSVQAGGKQRICSRDGYAIPLV